MAGKRRLHRDLGGLEVADLADHHDVGVLAQDRAQHVREGEPDLALHLDLVDTLELVFDRILDREQLLLGPVEAEQPGVERRGLAAAGRAGHQEDALRPAERFVQRGFRLGREA
jgi:hypothetical protein